MIELHRLTKRYGNVAAVDDLTATIKPGRVTGLVGPHEAGKTLTLRMILGLTAPTQGTATVLGRRYADLPNPMRQVGALLDPQGVHNGRRAADHLLCLARGNGIARWRVDEVLQITGLDRIAGRRIGTLSPCLRRRLGIAMTLLGDPDVLIYDSPTTGLDSAGVSWVHSLLRDLACVGRTVLVTGHQLSEMAGIADHFIVISRGRLIIDSSAEDLREAGTERRVLVRCDDPRFLAGRLAETGAWVRLGTSDTLLVSGLNGAEIHRLTVTCGVRLHELTPQRSSLDEVYLDLIGDNGGLYPGEGAA